MERSRLVGDTGDMDHARAVEVVDAALNEVGSYEDLHNQASSRSIGVTQFQIFGDSIRTQLVVIRAIAAEAAPHLLNRLQPIAQAFDHEWAHARNALVELRGELSQQDEIQAILGPSGPRLEAAALHPTIWSAASRLWDDGHHRSAVQTAATALEGVLQELLGRDDVAGTDLAKAFNLEAPTEEWPRLRIRGISSTSKTWKSAHEGAGALVRGAFLYVRNLVSHPGGPEAEEIEALEHLAVLSTIARIVDRSELVLRAEVSRG